MDEQKFLEQFHDQFVDADKLSLNMDDNFRTNDMYDSLTGMAILVMIKDEYGVEFSIDEFRQQNTVADVFQLIKSKM